MCFKEAKSSTLANGKRFEFCADEDQRNASASVFHVSEP